MQCALTGKNCPQTNDRSRHWYCPAWTEGLVWTNTLTGQEKIVHCAFEMLMPAIIEVIKASNRPAAAIENTRNEIVAGFQTLAEVINLNAQQRFRLLQMVKGGQHALESKGCSEAYQEGDFKEGSGSVEKCGQ